MSWRIAALAVSLCLVLAGAGAAPEGACKKAEFEAVVDEAAAALRDLNLENDEFLKRAAPFVSDEAIAVFDRKSEDLLTEISTLGQEGAEAKKPDCGLLLELRARMKLLVETQTAKWSYMFDKIETELWK